MKEHKSIHEFTQETVNQLLMARDRVIDATKQEKKKDKERFDRGQIANPDKEGELKETNRGNKYIVLFTDYYTKWVEAFPLTDMEATTVAQKLITGIMCIHGAPERIISDRGLNFTSEVFKEVTLLLDIKL